jgi:ADP-ribosyl-[dinitrogen reductase] hydrolase
MLAGAYYGMESIPRRWLKKMDRKVVDEVTMLAEQLVALSPWGAARLSSPTAGA